MKNEHVTALEVVVLSPLSERWTIRSSVFAQGYGKPTSCEEKDFLTQRHFFGQYQIAEGYRSSHCFFPKASQYSVAGITVDVDYSPLAVTTRDSTVFLLLMFLCISYL